MAVTYRDSRLSDAHGPNVAIQQLVKVSTRSPSIYLWFFIVILFNILLIFIYFFIFNT